MIHARHLNHSCVTYEAQVVMARRAGVGLELVVDSEHDPHVNFPLLHLTDSMAQLDLACGSRRNVVLIRQKVRYACFDNASGAAMKFKALQSLVLSCILLSTNVRAQEAAKPAASRTCKNGRRS